MPAEIRTEKRGSSLIITFSRPAEGNSFTFEMAMQLTNVLKPLTTDRGVRAVLLWGDGGDFMNGLETHIFAGDLTKATDLVNQMMQPYHGAIRELHSIEKPVIAAVKGRVVGPGMSFMLASDIVIAARSATFSCDCTTRALSPDGAASFFLTRKVGAARAMEILMLNETFNAAQAEKWGLLNTVVDDDKLQETALQWLDRLAEGPTRAYAAIKALVGKAYEQNLATHLSLEHTYWAASTRTFDFKEAIRAHFAKRVPKYTGA